MLLIIFLGLITSLTLVSGVCDYGTRGMDDFDFIKVGIFVWTGFLKQITLKFFVGS